MIEITVQDPETGEDYTFTGSTEDEALAEVDRFFGVLEADGMKPNGPSKAAIDKKLNVLETKIAKVKDKINVANVRYAATPDGAAEAFRAYEIESDIDRRFELLSLYTAGVEESDNEYQTRVGLGHDSEEDGVVQALAVNINSDLGKLLVQENIYGTIRMSDHIAKSRNVPVTIMRVSDAEKVARRRMNVVLSFDTDPLSLEEVLGEIVETRSLHSRLRQVLGAAAESVFTALERG